MRLAHTCTRTAPRAHETRVHQRACLSSTTRDAPQRRYSVFAWPLPLTTSDKCTTTGSSLYWIFMLLTALAMEAPVWLICGTHTPVHRHARLTTVESMCSAPAPTHQVELVPRHRRHGQVEEQVVYVGRVRLGQAVDGNRTAVYARVSDVPAACGKANMSKCTSVSVRTQADWRRCRADGTRAHSRTTRRPT